MMLLLVYHLTNIKSKIDVKSFYFTLDSDTSSPFSGPLLVWNATIISLISVILGTTIRQSVNTGLFKILKIVFFCYLINCVLPIIFKIVFF